MKEHLMGLWQYKNLIWLFVQRDLQARYKQTFLGVGWAVIQPLFLMLVFSLIFDKFLKVDSSGIPYPIFSYAALLPWLFISRSMNVAATSLIGFKALVTKVYFPREIVPLSIMVSSLVDFAIGSLVFFIMLLHFKVDVGGWGLFLVFLVPMMILLAGALALIVSTLTAIFRDLQFAMPLFVQLWMYASPVIYGLQGIQKTYLPLFYLNPAAGIIDSFRRVILLNQAPNWGLLASSGIWAVGLFVFGYWLFKKLEGFVIDIL